MTNLPDDVSLSRLDRALGEPRASTRQDFEDGIRAHVEDQGFDPDLLEDTYLEGLFVEWAEDNISERHARELAVEWLEDADG